MKTFENDVIIRNARQIVADAKAAGLVSFGSVRPISAPARRTRIPVAPSIKLPPGMFGMFSSQPLQIIKAVAAAHRLTLKEVLGSSRPEHISHPRQLAMCLVRKLTPLSLNQIAAIFGKKDHGTILWAVAAIEERCCDRSFKEAYDQWLKFDYSVIE